MLETPAVIVGTDERTALVKADYGGGCGSGMCSKGGCGTAVLGRIFSSNPRGPMRVGNPIQARLGERVIVGVEEGTLLRTTLLAYLLPLLMLVVGALGARAWFPGGDTAGALGALGGLMVGWAAARTLGRRVSGTQPVILRRA